MIRWWDYISVFFYADIMATWLLVLLMAPNWYIIFLAMLVLAIMWFSWDNFYCQWRLRYEESRQ